MVTTRTLSNYLASLPPTPGEDATLVTQDLQAYSTANILTASDVSAVAISGAYTDLSGLPTLGTAAAQNVEAFATAAQGNLADSAVQPAEIGTAAYEDASDFATASQGQKADTAVQAIVAGTLINVDNTDPQNPVISVTGGGSGIDIQAGDGILVDNTDPNEPIISVDDAYFGDLAFKDKAAVTDIDATGTPSSTNFLRGDGSWQAIAGAGTVTSVGVSVPTGFSASGSPVTSSGTIAITYAAGYQGYTSAEAMKLSGIASGATANAGTVTSVTASVPTGFSISGGPITSSGTLAITYSSGYQGYTSAESSKLSGIAAGAEVNVNADWNAASGDAQILNKPALGTAAAANTGDFATAAQGTLASTAVQPVRSISTGIGLTGGGDLSVDRSLAIDKATAANIRARTSNKVLTGDNVASAKAAVALAYSATRSLVWTDGWFRTCTMTGNMTISNPTSVEAGDTIMLRLVGDSASERTISWGTNYKGNMPTETVTSTRALLVTLTATTTTEIVVSYVVIE